MKFHADHMVEFLQSIGLQGAELVDNIEEADYSLDAALNLVDASRSAIIKPKVEAEITSAIAGRVGGALEAELRRSFGVPAEKLAGMKDSDKIKAAVTHFMESQDASKGEITKKIAEITAAHEAALAAKDSEWQDKYTTVERQYQRRDMLDTLEAELKDTPLPANTNKRVFAEDLLNSLEGKYVTKWNPKDKKLELFTKEDPNMPAMVNGNTLVKLSDEAKAYAEPRGLWMTDNRQQPPAGLMQQLQGQQQPQQQPSRPQRKGVPDGADLRAAFGVAAE